jgi:serine/threonine protein kinase
MISAPSTAPNLLQVLEQLALLPGSVLAEIRATPNRRSEEILASLVQAGYLTRFQAQALTRGVGTQLLVNGYLLLEPIGQGATGTVYKARAMQTGALVALKLVPRRHVVNL